MTRGLKNPVPDAVMDSVWIAIGDLSNYEFNKGFAEQRRKQEALLEALSGVRDCNMFHAADEGLEVECPDNGNPFEEFCLAGLRWDVAACGVALAGLRSRDRQLTRAARKAMRKIHEFMVATSINPLVELKKGQSFRVKLTVEDRKLLREMHIKDCPEVGGSL
jgi:hypothetical protein